jgi:hypothetical protein
MDSANKFTDTPWDASARRIFFPKLHDLHEKIDEVVARKRYDRRLEMDISAALRARIGSLLLGSKGAMLDTSVSLPVEELMGTNVVLEMSSMGNDDEKSLVMALVISALGEHVKTRALGGRLRHVLIIEEAHRLLRNTGPADNPEIANIRGAAVEQFSNMLAEMRAFGQGIIIADQLPAKMHPDVVKNTNLKMVHQLCAADDRQMVGDTMTLDKRQQDELARLEPNKGQGVVYQQNWEQAYMITVPKGEDFPAPRKSLQDCREATIDRYPEVYGEDREYIGTCPQEAGGQERMAFSRILLGLAAGSLDLTEKGLDPFAAVWDPIQDTSNGPSVPGNLYESFNDFLLDLLRLYPARMQMLVECPEMFSDLIRQICYGQDESSQIFKELRGTLLRALSESDSPEETMLGVAAKYYVETFGLQEVLSEIGQTKEQGDAAYESAHKRFREHTESICEEDVSDDIRKNIEVSLFGAAAAVAGFVHTGEVVENYRRRFL